MSLLDDLRTQRVQSLKNSPEMGVLVENFLAGLRAAHAGEQAPKVNDMAPDFALQDARGNWVSLADRLSVGPVVLTFYRGGWCPYCNLTLRAYQAILGRIRDAGASLMAISPQTPDASLSTAEKNALAFDVLSDAGSAVAVRYGLAFTMPEALQAAYRERNIPVTTVNDADDWMLPIPATFVIAQDRRVALSFVDVDYRVRLEPDAILAALTSLRPAAGRAG